MNAALEQARCWLDRQPPLFVAETEPEALAFQASVVADVEDHRELLGVVAEAQVAARARVAAWLRGFEERGGVAVSYTHLTLPTNREV